MTYVDGFVIPVPEGELETYREVAENAGKIWKEHGALDYKECVIDDDAAGGMRSFAEIAGAKEGEIVVFSYIVFESREHRDEVNRKVMADPRIEDGFDSENPPFDCKRIAYGGFKTIVEF